jgi:syntaxin 5
MGDGSRPNSKGKGRAIHDGDVLALDLDSAEEGSTQHGGNAFMQMQQIEQQVT